ncbi:MAG: tryptophan synthase subunit alpha [Candidatus Bipolaricaulia bacterium]
MSKIASKIIEPSRESGGAFIPYLMAGDPSPDRSLDYIRALAAGGADLIELGVPFSDPVADGSAIQAAGKRALESTNNLDEVFNLVRKVKENVEIPVILMSYLNPIFQYGKPDFFEESGRTGVSGVILPDLPPEEGEDFLKVAKNYSVDVPLLATPATTEKRLARISEIATGFLYLVARPGTTGAKNSVEELTTKTIKKVKPQLPEKLPVCVGFGLSTPEQVSRVISAGADGAIVGSAIVEKVSNGEKPEAVERFVRDLKEATKG